MTISLVRLKPPNLKLPSSFAARNCTLCCDILCGVNQSLFVADKNHGVISSTIHRSDSSWPTPFKARDFTIRRHPNEMWWLNPRRQPTYCQWILHRLDYSRLQEEPVMDESIASREHTRFWLDNPDKFFEPRIWDKAQNQLATAPDTGARVIYFPHTQAYYQTPFVYMAVAVILAILISYSCHHPPRRTSLTSDP
jgi:hypothetical protein